MCVHSLAKKKKKREYHTITNIYFARVQRFPVYTHIIFVRHKIVSNVKYRMYQVSVVSLENNSKSL